GPYLLFRRKQRQTQGTCEADAVDQAHPPSSRRASIPTDLVAASLDQSLRCGSNRGMPAQKISVFLADDNLIVREGVRALIGTAADMEVVGVASDYDELVAGAERAAPQVVVTDIRMPPTFQREGIEA